MCLAQGHNTVTPVSLAQGHKTVRPLKWPLGLESSTLPLSHCALIYTIDKFQKSIFYIKNGIFHPKKYLYNPASFMLCAVRITMVNVLVKQTVHCQDKMLVRIANREDPDQTASFKAV